METKGYTKLVELFEQIGIDFYADKNTTENEAVLTINDDANGGRLSLYFRIDRGAEIFIRQEIE